LRKANGLAQKVRKKFTFVIGRLDFGLFSDMEFYFAVYGDILAANHFDTFSTPGK